MASSDLDNAKSPDGIPSLAGTLVGRVVTGTSSDSNFKAGSTTSTYDAYTALNAR